MAAAWTLLCLLLGVVAVTECTGYRWNTCPRRRCYEGLFMPKQVLSHMETSNSTLLFGKLYNVTSYDVKKVYNESCGVRTTSSQTGGVVGVSLLDCHSPLSSNQDTPAISKRSPCICEACCRTEMSIAVPINVTDVVSGVVYPVKHFENSFQLLNMGHCLSDGASCGFGGTCTQANRVQWLLVTALGQDTFVSTSIPSHCTCIYT
ncbi:hypothetical protein ACOMHN_033296 [Nucella lapillus]